MTYVPVALRGREGGSQIEAGEPGEPAFTVRTPGGGSSLPMVAHAITAREAKGADSDATSDFIVAAPLTAGSAAGKGVNAPGWRREDDINLVTHALTSEGADASEDGTGRGTPLVAVPVAWRGRGMEAGEEGVANAIRSGGDGHTGDQMGYVMTATATGFNTKESRRGAIEGLAPTLRAESGDPHMGGRTAVAHAHAVRRLTPLECERLQGFPDRWTLYQADGSEQSDSTRYRQLGNSVAVPCVAWITRRIAAVEAASEALGGRMIALFIASRRVEHDGTRHVIAAGSLTGSMVRVRLAPGYGFIKGAETLADTLLAVRREAAQDGNTTAEGAA